MHYPQRASRLLMAGVVIAIVALIDWRVKANIAFGFLYLFPILLVGTVAPRWQVVSIAVLCTLLADLLGPFPFNPSVAFPQDILVFSALTGMGLFSHEVTRSQVIEAENLRRLEKEVAARREAEEQLEFLIESSPAAILTMSADFRILKANPAAHHLLRVPPGELTGKSVLRYLPALGPVPFLGDTLQAFRTEMQCHGEREEGEVFLADVFFSTYSTALGSRMAALVVDSSEHLREREELNLEQVMAGSRILVGAVSHEIRNVCSAIAVVYENLARSGRLDEDKDFEALGALVEALNKIAALELKQSTIDSEVGQINLLRTIDDLRIVLEPYCREAEISLAWHISKDLPEVWADSHRLLLAFLNLVKNSERALSDAEVKKIDIAVSAGKGLVSIRVTDSGPGVSPAATENLFQPFKP
ncbi:MAG: PAS domain-containing protein, partial [Blastocatellia bacterium]